MKRPFAGIRGAIRNHGNDDAMTLVEVLMASTLLLVLLTVTSISLSAYLSTSTGLIASYNATQQLLPSSVIIQRLIRSEVEPGPQPTPTVANPHPTPTPPFAVMSASPYTSPPAATQPGVTPVAPTVYPSTLTVAMTASSLSFYANVGNPNGPVEIVMQETADPCQACSFPTWTFQVAEIAPAAHSCPGVSAGVACTYPAADTPKDLVTVDNVVNGPANTKPIFSYTLLNNGVVDPVAPGNVASLNTTGCTGSATLATTCPADTIQSINVDLQIHVKGAPVQETSFLVYRLSSYSYLYSPLVG